MSYNKRMHGLVIPAITPLNHNGKVDEQPTANYCDLLATILGIPALKALLKKRGVIKTDVCRAPLRQLEACEYKILESVIEKYKREENVSD